jgi:phage tail-like protein
MGSTSSYLQYLPPVLWGDEPEDAEFSLGGLLRIFEKVLTGIPDGVATSRPALTDTIAAVPRLFDPWTVDPDFLPWLAGFVDLRFPTLQGRPLWGEHQQRAVVARIARTYPRRGQKGGLAEHLELCAVGEVRPRIALDDGSRVLTTTPAAGGPSPVAALVTQGPVLDPAVTGASSVLADGLVRPSCLAIGADGALFLGDLGAFTTLSLALGSRIWRLSADGRYDVGGDPPKPRPLATGALENREVVALAVRPAAGGQPETLLVLDAKGRLSAMPRPAPGAALGVVAELAQGVTGFAPVAMCLDRNGDVLVLDRGTGPGTPHPATIVTVAAANAAVSRRALTQAVFPLSLHVLRSGALVIGDAREQEPAGPDRFAGSLLRVDRTDPAHWAETVLLGGGPLVAPTALAQDDDGLLYVLDAGLKPLVPPADPFVLPVAEPAAVYRVDLSADPPRVRRVTEPGRLVYPTGMAARAGRLVICDPGQPQYLGQGQRWARVLPHRFEIVVHFTASRLPAENPQREQVLHRTVLNIEAMVDEQKPAHTHWTPVTTS